MRRAKPERGRQAHTALACVLSYCVYMYVTVCACTHTYTRVYTGYVYQQESDEHTVSGADRLQQEGHREQLLGAACR